MLFRRYDVFLSYSRADSERVQPLLRALRAQGYRVFFDVQSIEPGTQWKRRLERAIRASRALVLCWSEHAQGSDYITFEYSKAEALGKPVYPWLIDKTPLPAMLDLQGIANPDGAHVAQVLRPYLGWTLHRRHLAVAGALAILLALFSAGIWRALHPPPPPPWLFEGTVIDNVEQMPIAGVEVDLDIGDGHPHPAWTDPKGKYRVQLPAPRPATLEIRFRKTGYQADTILHAKASDPYDEILIPEKQPNTKKEQ